MTNLENAINLLLQNVKEKQVEWEFISNLKDRVLAQDVFSPIDKAIALLKLPLLCTVTAP